MNDREKLDLTGIPCPKNTAQALLHLETLDEGDELEIIVDDGEPISNMISSFAIEPDLEVLNREQAPGQTSWRVIVKKKG